MSKSAKVVLGFVVLIALNSSLGAERQTTALATDQFAVGQRQELIRRAKSSCINAHKRNTFDRRVIDFIEPQMIAYCECSAVQIVNSMTIEEMGYVVHHGEFSADFKNKLKESRAACGRSLFL